MRPGVYMRPAIIWSNMVFVSCFSGIHQIFILAFPFDPNMLSGTYIICNTFTPQIKGKYCCKNVILHWLWNILLISVHAYISLRHSTNPLHYLMARWNYCALYVATTNSILTMAFDLENQVYFEGLLKPITSDKNLVAADYT